MIVYLATNKINGLRYIGQTILPLEERISNHFKTARFYKNKHNYFHNALLKYDKENFKWEILCKCETIEELNRKEIEMIKKFNTLWPNGYNLKTGGLGGRHSEETKKKMKESHADFSGENNPMYRKIPWNKGKHLFKKHKEKISKANKGIVRSEETKQKISKTRVEKEVAKGKNNPMYRKHHSKTTKEKISEVLKGKNHPFYGKHHSEETKRKMSKSATARWLRQKRSN